MRIALITHPKDPRLAGSARFNPWRAPVYQIEGVVRQLRAAGHRVFYVSRLDEVRPADAAIVHVDQTVVGLEFDEIIASYPVTVNGRVRDITKRNVSTQLLQRDADWQGKVIVKSDLNARGSREYIYAGRANAFAFRAMAPPYRIYDTLGEVPGATWSDPRLIVERYRPEMKDGLHVLRIWNFMGDYERCTGYTTPEAIAKGRNVVDSFPSDIPPEIRAERERLGSDYGKYDFAITETGPVLYDANKTPGFLRSRPDIMQKVGHDMAEAVLRLIAERRDKLSA